MYSDRARAAGYLEKVDNKRLGFDGGTPCTSDELQRL
jgi:hypothetical protein